MFDAYTWHARLAPLGVASLPMFLLLVPALLNQDAAVTACVVLASFVGCVVCGSVRDRGRRLEGELWASWGGPPTTLLLMWSGPGARAEVERHHREVEMALDIALPTEEEERADPVSALRAYEEAVRRLRELTRNRDDFPLVFDENKEYGFRRNALGLRTAGMAVAAVTFVLAAGLTLFISPWFLMNMLFGLAAFAWWMHVVSPAWVRQPADLYATRLLDASITLSPR